jgi:hypothetical protein
MQHISTWSHKQYPHLVMTPGPGEEDLMGLPPWDATDPEKSQPFYLFPAMHRLHRHLIGYRFPIQGFYLCCHIRIIPVASVLTYIMVVKVRNTCSFVLLHRRRAALSTISKEVEKQSLIDAGSSYKSWYVTNEMNNLFTLICLCLHYCCLSICCNF